ncbi:hypothetical protein MJT46_011305 [Ovis ammon polii x Ovis aries]|nr:hypothetical protein MJT46_011305 [Ovis ammon polii x Ovis aries]
MPVIGVDASRWGLGWVQGVVSSEGDGPGGGGYKLAILEPCAPRLDPERQEPDSPVLPGALESSLIPVSSSLAPQIEPIVRTVATSTGPVLSSTTFVLLPS